MAQTINPPPAGGGQPPGGQPPTPPSTSQPDPMRGPETMRRSTGHIITAIAYLVPASILASIGLGIGNYKTAAALALVWIGPLFASSIRFQRVRTFLVVERFGYFWDIKFAGLRHKMPLIDNDILEEDFLQKEVPLFRREVSDEQGQRTEMIQIDFTGITTPNDTAGTALSAGGASAPVDCSAWYQVANPNDVEGGHWPEVRKQVFWYTYRVRAAERASRVAEIFQNAFRPKLEACTLAYAEQHSKEIAEEAVNDAREPLAEIGAYPFPKKGITVRDIDLPPKLAEMREQALQGQIEAEAAINRSKGYYEPIKLMKEGLYAAGLTNLTDQEIIDLFLKQRGLEAIANIKELSIVASDIDNAVKTINVGSARPRP